MEINGQFILMDREEFKQWIDKQTFGRQVYKIQNHHTWLPDYKTLKGQNYISVLYGMKEYHVKNAGFSDIAQNLTTYPDGRIAVCRTFEKSPAGIYNQNTGSLCIEHIGNFDEGMDVMTEEHKQTIVFLNAILCKKYNLTPSTDSIVYHHWYDLNTGERLDYGNGKIKDGVTKSCPAVGFFGGNTVDSANKYFIPLVKEKLNELKGNVKSILKINTLNETRIVISEKLNIRKEPSTSSDIIGELVSNDVINTVGLTDNGWYKLSIGGFVFGTYTKAYAPQVTIEDVKEVINMLFKDESEISGWALEAVTKMKELGIVKGDNNGNFNPKDPISREALMVVLYNTLKMLGKV